MRAFLSSTVLLGVGSVTHALRVIVLSLLLGNRDFGAVSTILLLSTLFAEFGSLGFSQLVYNQPLYGPRVVDRASLNVARYLATGLTIIAPMAGLTALAIAAVGEFHFASLFATLICAGANVMILASLRSSNNKFTHPVGYVLKSLIVLLDIAVLGSGMVPIEYMVLVGEIASTPVLLVYAWRSGTFQPRWSILRKVPDVIKVNRVVAVWALASSMSALFFLNQERIAGAVLFDLEEMGIITKIILIKIIGAQAAFLFGTYFHRFIVDSDLDRRLRTFAQIRGYEGYLYLALAVACAAMTIPLQVIYVELYDIALEAAVAFSVLVLAIVFFFNPFAILLQASGRFVSVARCNVIAIGLFSAMALFAPDGTYVIVASAIAALVWYGLVRRAAWRLLGEMRPS